MKWDWQSHAKEEKETGRANIERICKRKRDRRTNRERELEIEWDIECVIRRGIDRDRGIVRKRVLEREN